MGDYLANKHSLLDHFALFAIPRKLRIDSAKLEARFHTLQMASHPDKFASSDPVAIELAENTSASINQAYRVLREPIARLKYLLSLYGYSVERSKAVPQSLLMSVMEAQEAIGGLEMAQNPSEVDALRSALSDLSVSFDNKLSQIADDRKRLSAEWDAANEHAKDRESLTESERNILDQLVKLLAERAYLETLSASIHAALAGETAMIRH